MQVVSLGELVDDERYFRVLSTGVVPFPVGYSIQRPVVEQPGRSAKNAPPSTCAAVFTATILRGDDGPEFEVTRSDASDVVHHSNNISTVWRDALIAAEAAYPELVEQRTTSSPGGKSRGAGGAKGASPTSRPAVNGLVRFGLTSEAVLRQLRALPGGDALWAHADATKKKTPEEEGVVEVVEVPDSQDAVAAKPKAKKGGAKAKTSDDGTGAVQSNVGKKSATAKAAAVIVQKYVKCAVCGSESTPFCASTGKPHKRVAAPEAAVPCPDCGLGSAFCSSTGKEHPLAHIPVDGAPTGKRQRKQSTGGPSTKRAKNEQEGVSKVEADLEDDSQPLFVLGLHNESDAAVDGAGQKAKKPRGKKSENAKSADGPSTGEPSLLDAFLRQTTLDESGKAGTKRKARGKQAPATNGESNAAGGDPSNAKKEDNEADEMPVEEEKPKGYVYPKRRPPLAHSEQTKAKVAIQKMWASRLQESDGHILVAPLIEGITLPVGGGVMAKTSTKRKGAPRRGRKPGSAAKDGDADGEEDGDGDEDEDGENDADNNLNNNDADEAAADAAGEASEAAGAASSGPVGAPSHPLDVCDVSVKTVTGKRFLHFMTMYTSERAKNDLLRRDHNATSSPAAPTAATFTAAAGAGRRAKTAQDNETAEGAAPAKEKGEGEGDTGAAPATPRAKRHTSVSPQPTQSAKRGRSESSKGRIASKSRSPDATQKLSSIN